MSKYVWTNSGIARVIEEKGLQLVVQMPGRKGPRNISKNAVEEIPERILLARSADFDQECGCTAVVEVRKQTVERFNVYGSVRKFAASGQEKGYKASPYFRRKFLAENGFMRAVGQRSRERDVGGKIFQFMKEGYSVVKGTMETVEKTEKVIVEKKEELAAV